MIAEFERIGGDLERDQDRAGSRRDSRPRPFRLPSLRV
jgi:hypothetical protein